MTTKVYTIPTKPVAWQRPGRSEGRFYDTQTHLKNSLGFYLEQQHGDLPPFKGPIEIDMKFYFPIPKTVRKRPNTIDMWHITVPDADNLLKLLYDTLQRSEIIINDKIVCKGSFSKQYDKVERTVITITELT